MSFLGDQAELERLLAENGDFEANRGLNLGSHEIRTKILAFYELMRLENEVQNITRLVGPSDFIDYHLSDVLELLKTHGLVYPILDLGSGGGIPGVLAALIDQQNWILTESEQRKAEYLQRTVNQLGLSERVSVFSGRAELYLKSHRVGTIASRAVGSVEKIYGWIRKCSTWNKLILFKGPGWEAEWKSFLDSPFRNELQVVGEVNYFVGPEKKTRKLIQLKRS
jgi:16S rRNA (guanine(527)-N(7))-methyltransferase RsmG